MNALSLLTTYLGEKYAYILDTPKEEYGNIHISFFNPESYIHRPIKDDRNLSERMTGLNMYFVSWKNHRGQKK